MKFYDTCSLLLIDEEELKEKFAISSITLKELEEIKTSIHKTEDIKYKAKKLINWLRYTKIPYETIIYKEFMADIIKEKELVLNNDTMILACAIWLEKLYPDDLIFVTNDLSLYNIANLFFGEDSIESIEQTDDYTGYIEITPSDVDIQTIYSSPELQVQPIENTFNALVNQYIIIKDHDNDYMNTVKWTGKNYTNIHFKDNSFKSEIFGQIKPKDKYQIMAFDSLYNNQITMLAGPAGTGKTFIALGYLFAQLEQHKIDKIIVFCNTVATKNSAKLGFYPGTRDEKLLDSQIGNLLSSKLGSKFAVEQLIEQDKLVLLPFSDIRGYDTSGMNAGIYISEAQNLDIMLIKLALQRLGEDCICIIDGDYNTQVDNINFSGANNGMKRVSQVFRGTEFYGQVNLNKIHRSKIARLAEGL